MLYLRRTIYLPHHEDDVAYAGDAARVPELLDNLAGRQVALEAHRAGRAEGAPHLAADLRGHAQRGALLAGPAVGRTTVLTPGGTCALPVASESMLQGFILGSTSADIVSSATHGKHERYQCRSANMQKFLGTVIAQQFESCAEPSIDEGAASPVVS